MGHSRHIAFGNFLANLISGLLAYAFLPKKPTNKIRCRTNFWTASPFLTYPLFRTQAMNFGQSNKYGKNRTDTKQKTPLFSGV
jgi:hypothetical protein